MGDRQKQLEGRADPAHTPQAERPMIAGRQDNTGELRGNISQPPRTPSPNSGAGQSTDRGQAQSKEQKKAKAGPRRLEEGGPAAGQRCLETGRARSHQFGIDGGRTLSTWKQHAVWGRSSLTTLRQLVNDFGERRPDGKPPQISRIKTSWAASSAWRRQGRCPAVALTASDHHNNPPEGCGSTGWGASRRGRRHLCKASASASGAPKAARARLKAQRRPRRHQLRRRPPRRASAVGSALEVRCHLSDAARRSWRAPLPGELMPVDGIRRPTASSTWSTAASGPTGLVRRVAKWPRYWRTGELPGR